MNFLCVLRLNGVSATGSHIYLVKRKALHVLAAPREATASFFCGSRLTATGPTREKLALLS